MSDPVPSAASLRVHSSPGRSATTGTARCPSTCCPTRDGRGGGRPLAHRRRATCSTWPTSSARRCSSTTRPTCAAAAARRSRRSGPTVRLRHQGVPLPGHGPPRPRGGHAPRRRDRRRARTSPCRPACPPTGSSCTATTSRRRAARRARRRRRPDRRRLRSTSSTGSRRSSPPARRRPKVLLRITPGVEAHTHEFVRPARTTPSSGSALPLGRRGRGRRPGPAIAAVELVGLHAHIGSQIFVADFFDAAVEVAGAPFVATHGPARARRRRRPRRRLRRGRGGAVDHRVGRRRSREACAGAGHHRPRSPAEPGRAIVAAAAVTLYTVGTIKDIPGIRTYVAVDGGMSDNPRPGALRQRLRGVPAPGVDADRPRLRPRGRQALRVGRRARARRPACPPTSPSATSSPPRSPAPTATRWARTTTRCPARPSCSSRDGEARLVVRRETVDDLLATDLG